MARRHRRVESLEEGAVDLLDLERHLNRPAQPPRQPDDGVVLWGAQLLKLVGKIQQRSSQELPNNLGQILHMEPVIHLRNVFVIRISYSAVVARPLLSSPFSCSGIILEHRFPRNNRLDLAQTRAPAFTRANDTGHALTHEVQARRSRDTRSGSPSRARYAGRSLHSPDGRTHPREGTRNARVGHADFGSSRSRRHRGLCACVARGTIGA